MYSSLGIVTSEQFRCSNIQFDAEDNQQEENSLLAFSFSLIAINTKITSGLFTRHKVKSRTGFSNTRLNLYLINQTFKAKYQQFACARLVLRQQK